jgi:beta-glucosidase
LRKQWGFRGYVVSDSDAVEYVFAKHHVAPNYEDAVRQVLQAGLNVRTTFTPPEDFIIPVRSLVKKGFLSKSDLDARVRDVLRVKFWLGLFDSPYRGDLAKADRIVASDQHQEVALQAARESLVLLKNRNAALPLDRRISKISVIGPNATNTDWAHKQYGPMHVDVPTVLDQIKQIAGQSVAVEYAKGCSITTADFPNDELYERELSADEQKGFDEAIAVARRSDTVILVLGENNQTSGESRTRSSLNLPGRQEKLARELAKLGKPMIAVVIAGRPLTINWLQDNVDAILFGFSPGAKGPRAIAETLFGFNNPSGKMPVTTPKSVGQIPYNFPTKPAANEEGMSRLAAVSGALYPFGFGLSYTTFKYAEIKLESDSVKAGDDVVVSFSVTNSGDRIGTEISQVYFHQQTSSVTTYERRLGGFVRITLAPKETKRTTVRIPGAELAILDRKMKWRIEPGKFQVFVGGSSADTPLNSLFEVR